MRKERKMLDKMVRNWVRVVMWMITAIAFAESVTIVENHTLKIIMWIGSGVLFTMGCIFSGEELLDGSDDE